jgi:hypothetical protein
MNATRCPKCTQIPGYHSFLKIGLFDNKALFYTSAAKTQDFNEDGTKLANIKIHIDEIGVPWIWVFDCNNMELKHYTEISFNVGLLEILTNDKNLAQVWILRPNIWIKTVIALLKTFSNSYLLNNIRYFEGNNLELYNSLLETNISSQLIHRLIAQ